MPSPPLRFSGTIRIRGVNPYVKVSKTQARLLKPDWRRPMPVRVRVNGQPKRSAWKINMMPAGDGSFFLYLHGEVRKSSGTGVGDRVALEVSFDHSYRGGPAALPAELTQALARNAAARAGWKGLTPSRQKEIVRYLANLKTDVARQRVLGRALEALEGKARRFMARDW